MAPPAGTLRVGRYFLALGAIFVLLYSIVAFGSRQTPKLGLDLVGGAQVTFTALTDNGTAPSADAMTQAKQIITDRVNGNGVSGAEIVIQGSDQIVVSVPGGTQADINKLGAAAVLNFRSPVTAGVPISCVPPGSGKGSSATSGATTSGVPSASTSVSVPAPTASASAGTGPSASPTASHSAQAESVRALGAASPSATASPVVRKATSSATPGASSSATSSATSGASSSAASSAAPSGSASPSASAATPSAPPVCRANSLQLVQKAGKFSLPLTDTAFGQLTQQQQQLLRAGLADYACTASQSAHDDPTKDFVACDTSHQIAYLLGPVIVAGKQIADATVSAPGNGSLQYAVNLTLKSSGQAAWADWTSAHNVSGADPASLPGSTGCSLGGTRCANYVCFTLDGTALTCPVTTSVINGQATQITGNFTSSSAATLAQELKYGALPLSFRADQAQTVSATLGSSQLKAGLLAGGIGLILVVIYSLLYYRALGLVTIASLIVSGGLTYGSLVLLGTQIGFTLSLAGIAGFIVAVGITADSFVVFFERLKDEVHEGRSVRVAVPRAWIRARRTILSADTVSFLAAAILYYFAAGDVRGFAFTLGLSTILDLVVVFLFTHPVVSLLSRSATFGSARFTGLNALRGTPIADEPPAARPARGRRTSTGAADAGGTGRAGVTTAVLDSGADRPTDGSDEVADTPGASVPPASGATAAERAAARRARLRAQDDTGGSTPADRTGEPDEEQ